MVSIHLWVAFTHSSKIPISKLENLKLGFDFDLMDFFQICF